MKKDPRGPVYKTARISYLHNYVLVVLGAIVLIWLYPMLDLSYIIHYVIFFGLLMAIAGLWEEPEIQRLLRRYVVTNDEIIKIEGIIRKNIVSIPYQSIANVTISQGVIGRLLRFGNVTINVSAGKGDMIMRGMKDPYKIQRMIENKIALLRKAYKKSEENK